MSRPIRFSEAASADLRDIYDYIAAQAGFDVADVYVERMIASCEKLRDHAKLGRPRDGLLVGLRSISFERRATIFYTVEQGMISVERVAAKGRDLRKMFSRSGD
ncbi:MAG TPA: type II toxin-antitoxin system RelE/ParE family toxin [Allosphingosinicella sp.]